MWNSKKFIKFIQEQTIENILWLVKVLTYCILKYILKQCTEEVLISNLLELSSFSLPLLLIFMLILMNIFPYCLFFMLIVMNIFIICCILVSCYTKWPHLSLVRASGGTSSWCIHAGSKRNIGAAAGTHESDKWWTICTVWGPSISCAETPNWTFQRSMFVTSRKKVQQRYECCEVQCWMGLWQDCSIFWIYGFCKKFKSSPPACW